MKRKPQPWRAEDVSAVLLLRKSGHPTREIARQMGMEYERVRDKLRALAATGNLPCTPPKFEERVPVAGLKKTSEEARRAGETYYFTGTACCRGHIEARYASTYRCVECVRQAQRSMRREATRLRAERSQSFEIQPAPVSPNAVPTPRSCLCPRCRGTRTFLSCDPPSVNRISAECAKAMERSSAFDMDAPTPGVRVAA